MSSIIEDLRAHGGVLRGGSGGSGTKLLKFTASLIAPQNPSQNDIWIKTSESLGNVYLDDIELPNPSVGDTLIKFGGREDLFKHEYFKSQLNHFGFRSSTSPSPVLLDSDVMAVYGFVGSVKTWNGEVYDYHDAYIWTGSEWYAFSYNLGGVLMFGSEPPSTATDHTLASYDHIFDLIVKTDNAVAIRSFSQGSGRVCVDPIRKLIGFKNRGADWVFSIYDYNTMTEIKTINLANFTNLAGTESLSNIQFCSFDVHGNLFIIVTTWYSAIESNRHYFIKYDSDFNKVNHFYLHNDSTIPMSVISYIEGVPYLFIHNSSYNVINLNTQVKSPFASGSAPTLVAGDGRGIFYATYLNTLSRYEFIPATNTLTRTHNLSVIGIKFFNIDNDHLYVVTDTRVERRSLSDLALLNFSNASYSTLTGGGTAQDLVIDRQHIYSPVNQTTLHQLDKRTMSLNLIKTHVAPYTTPPIYSKMGNYSMFSNMF